MRVAFTSSDGRMIDEHFGMASRFHVWEVGPDRAEPVGSVAAITTSDDEEDRISARVSAIEGCTLVYTVRIGGPAAAKLVARRVHPMKTGEETPICEVVARLQEVLKGRPPPWLRRAMGAGAEPEPESIFT